MLVDGSRPRYSERETTLRLYENGALKREVLGGWRRGGL